MLTAALLLAASLPSAQTAALPPPIPWSGASRSLLVSKSDPWVTPFEAGNLNTTPRYDETVAWLRRLVSASRDLRMVSLGRSPEGRDIWMVIASKDRTFTPEGLRRTGKPLVLAQAGIHSGEIEGKDAGMMLLRDMTVRGTKKELLDGANFLFVPIFSVDAHERFSRFTRINQRGPEEGGWRTNARNLNLNRDYTKADTEEMRAMLRALAQWQPDLYVDLHVTDGADYQYDVTFGWNGRAGFSPAISTWLDETFRAPVTGGLRAAGHVPGPLIFTDDPLSGIATGQADPRLSNGYGDARHIPTILVENHSLKPYDQRVLGMYVFLEHTLRVAARERESLRRAIAADRAERTRPVPFDWAVPEDQKPDQMEILGIGSRETLSPISGGVRVEWLGTPVTRVAPVAHATKVTESATRPRAYWIPAGWTTVIEKLDLHGIPYERIAAPRDVDVTMYRFSEPKFGPGQFEGHVRVTAKAAAEKRRETFPAGSVRVSMDQPLGTLAAVLLEPASPDSLFQWGFLHSVLTRTEYVEAYIMEPMAERMMAEDPKLAEEFRERVASDAAFRSDPFARLYWFYERTPFYDDRAMLYPIAREE